MATHRQHVTESSGSNVDRDLGPDRRAVGAGAEFTSGNWADRANRANRGALPGGLLLASILLLLFPGIGRLSSILSFGQDAVAESPAGLTPAEVLYRDVEALQQRLADELRRAGLDDEVARWVIRRDPQRIYVFFPDEGTTADRDATLQDVLHRHAERLLERAKKEAADGDPSAAARMLHEVLFFDPDYETVRRILGHRKTDDGWHVAASRLSQRRSTRAHAVVDWPAKSWSQVHTDHFEIASQADPQVTEHLAEQLERWHTVWRQIFFEFWSNGPALNRWIEGRGNYRIPPKRFQVVLFANRDDYVAQLSDSIRGIERSTGYYEPRLRTSFFYASDDGGTESTWRHELTHQLFQETRRATPEPFESAGLWLGEGIAMYMESLTDCGEYGVLGGFDSRRLQYARMRRLKEQYQVPFSELRTMPQEAFQRRDDIARLYSQSAALVHMLMDHEFGRWRRPLCQYLELCYSGKLKPTTWDAVVGLDDSEVDRQYPEFLKVSERQLVEHLLAPETRTELALIGISTSADVYRRLSECRRLNWLDLSGTDVRGSGLKELESCGELRQLFLTGCRIDVETLKSLAKWPALIELDLGGSDLDDESAEALGELRGLQVLNVSGTRITDRAADVIARLPQLKSLAAEGVDWSAGAVQRLERARPELDIQR